MLKTIYCTIAALLLNALIFPAGAQPANDDNSPAALPKVFLLDAKYIAATRQKIRNGDTSFAPALEALKRDADRALNETPLSVVSKTAVPPGGDKHDYMSQAPYFWPNPATSNGLPYIRRDGERNPEINKIHDHHDILAMPQTVETLALAYYYTGNEAFAAKAAEMLRVWFLDPATRMNPNFKYAQAVPGVNDGRGTGLIESRGLVYVVDAVGLLAGSKAWTPADQQGLQQWFTDFLDWMEHSKNGRAEAAAKNNHGTFYDIQTASFAFFLGKTEEATQRLQDVRTRRIAVQIEPDGREPLELVRTKAWSYSVANLSGLMMLAELGDNVGLDLWHYETPDGRGIRQALDFLAPFALGEKNWPYQQIGGWTPQQLYPLLRLAAEKYDDPKYQQWLKQIPAAGPASRTRLTSYDRSDAMPAGE
jgi:hypothetical protein